MAISWLSQNLIGMTKHDIINPHCSIGHHSLLDYNHCTVTNLWNRHVMTTNCLEWTVLEFCQTKLLSKRPLKMLISSPSKIGPWKYDSRYLNLEFPRWLGLKVNVIICKCWGVVQNRNLVLGVKLTLPDYSKVRISIEKYRWKLCFYNIVREGYYLESVLCKYKIKIKIRVSFL